VTYYKNGPLILIYRLLRISTHILTEVGVWPHVQGLAEAVITTRTRPLPAYLKVHSLFAKYGAIWISRKIGGKLFFEISPDLRM